MLGAVAMTTMTSCKDDKDDPKPQLSITVNGDSLINKETYKLGKGTIDPSEEGCDTIVLNLNNDKDIKKVILSVRNDYEDNVNVVDLDSIVLNDKQAESTGTNRTIKFIGVYGTYTLDVRTESGDMKYEFNLEREGKHQAYNTATRIVCNDQVLKFDADNKVYNNRIMGMTIKFIDVNSGYRFEEKSYSKLSEEEYNDFKTMSISTMYGEANSRTYSQINLENRPVPAYFVYKRAKDKYVLMKIVENNGNFVTAIVNY